MLRREKHITENPAPLPGTMPPLRGFALCLFLISWPAAAKNQVLDSAYLQVQADSFYLKGERAFFKKRGDEGVRFLKRAILYAPRSVHLRQKLAEYYTESGLWAEAAVQYEALLKQNPHLHSLRRRLIEIYAFNDLTRDALKHHKVLLKGNRNSFPLRLRYALLLMKDRQWPQALQALQKAGKKAVEANQQVEILLAEISVYGNLNRPQQQKKRLAEAGFLRPDREDLALKLAWLYTQFGNPAEAVHVLRDYQQRQRRSVPVTQSLADLFMVLNEKPEALRQLLKLKEWGALNLNRFFYLAGLLIERGEYKQAIPFLQDLLIHPSPFTDQSRYLLGTVYEKQKRFFPALKEYKNIPRKSAYFVPARIRQAQILREQGAGFQGINPVKTGYFCLGNLPSGSVALHSSSLEKKAQKQSPAYFNGGFKTFSTKQGFAVFKGALPQPDREISKSGAGYGANSPSSSQGRGNTSLPDRPLHQTKP